MGVYKIIQAVRRPMLSAAVLTGCLIATPALAQSQLESMKLAQNLGDLLASETSCNLHYDQAAIQAFINKRVRANDMDFSPSLTLMTAGAEAQMESMSQSAKTAHCAQVVRVARSYDFIH